jgi:hypothetical protein
MLSCNRIWVNLLSSIFWAIFLQSGYHLSLQHSVAQMWSEWGVMIGCCSYSIFGPLACNQVTTVPWQDEPMQVCYILLRYYYDDSFVVVLLLSLPLTWKHWLVAVNRALLKIQPAFLLSFQWLPYYYFQSAAIHMRIVSWFSFLHLCLQNMV